MFLKHFHFKKVMLRSFVQFLEVSMKRLLFILLETSTAAICQEGTVCAILLASYIISHFF